MSLSENDLSGLKASLVKKKEELERQLTALMPETDFGSDVDHFEEETDEAEEFANQLGVKKALGQRLLDINAALRRMELEHYGKCESCGKEIEIEILQIDPESRLCRECKKSA